MTHPVRERTLDADYLVVGAGATGMAFVDALVEHSEARVVLVDRRYGVSGHWLEAYPFVQLHQASAFYGVASTLLGGGAVQQHGPERGLQERASQPEICLYYDRLIDRFQGTGRVTFVPNAEYLGDRTIRSRVAGTRYTLPDTCRVVNAHHLAPSIPAEAPAPFAVAPGARVIPVNALARLEEAPRQYVVVGSGKTATDACIWLLDRGVDPDAICWVRPRDPWMLNRAAVQPDPAVFLGTAATTFEAAAAATSLDDLFLRLEDAGVMLRIDPTVVPTMAKTPTLAGWELEQLRTLQNVVRRGHVAEVERGRLVLDDGAVSVADDAVVVHCAADGLKQPPLVPVWGPGTITLQPVRAGFPCFGAALIGYVEATRHSDDDKNRLAPPSPYGNSLAEWARMNVLGTRAVQAFTAEPDIRDWADRVALNPARVPPEHPATSALDDARERLAAALAPGLGRMAALSEAG